MIYLENIYLYLVAPLLVACFCIDMRVTQPASCTHASQNAAAYIRTKILVCIVTVNSHKNRMSFL